MTTLNPSQGVTDAHVLERNAHMTPDNTCPPKIVTDEGAVYVLDKAPTDPSQLNTDITVQMHHKLRVAAEAHGMTLREYVQDTLAARLSMEAALYERA